MFAAFPEFSPLTLENKEKYEQYVSAFPPISDLSFATLRIWWGRPHPWVSTLNDNLVINYSGTDKLDYSSLSLIGTHKADESVHTIISEAKKRGGAGQLIHTPEFVVHSLENSEQLTIHEEPDHHEYIIPVSRFYPLDTVSSTRRWRVKKFEAQHDGSIKIIELPLDIGNRTLLMDRARKWGKSSRTDPGGEEYAAMDISFVHADALGIRNRCLFLGGKLKGFFTFHISADGMYLTGNHFKFDRGTPFVSDYLEYVAGVTAHELGVKYINLEMDLGIPGLRTHKVGLRPICLFKKYTITSKLKQ